MDACLPIYCNLVDTRRFLVHLWSIHLYTIHFTVQHVRPSLPKCIQYEVYVKQWISDDANAILKSDPEEAARYPFVIGELSLVSWSVWHFAKVDVLMSHDYQVEFSFLSSLISNAVYHDREYPRSLCWLWYLPALAMLLPVVQSVLWGFPTLIDLTRSSSSFTTDIISYNSSLARGRLREEKDPRFLAHGSFCVIVTQLRGMGETTSCEALWRGPNNRASGLTAFHVSTSQSHCGIVIAYAQILGARGPAGTTWMLPFLQRLRRKINFLGKFFPVPVTDSPSNQPRLANGMISRSKAWKAFDLWSRLSGWRWICHSWESGIKSCANGCCLRGSNGDTPVAGGGPLYDLGGPDSITNRP